MKKLLTTLVVLMFCLWPVGNSVGAPSHGNQGGVPDGDVTFSGTVTADGFDSPADEDEGGCLVLKECEDATGDCDTASNGESYSICLPDNVDPMTTSKEFTPGFTADWRQYEADFDGEDAGGRCIALSGTDVSCASRATEALATYPFLNGVFIDKCYVMLPQMVGWDAAGGQDRLVLQAYTVDTTDGTRAAFGDKFSMIEGVTTGCAGITETTNCVEAVGTHEWQVDRDEALCENLNVPYHCCTAASTGATCSGASAVAQGSIQIEIDAESEDVDTDAVAQFHVRCLYF